MNHVAIIDSGIGGLAVLSRLKYSVPATYYYYADTGNMPYDKQDKSTLRYKLEKIILYLLSRYPIDTVIIACNTMALSSIGYIRHIFPDVNFVGCEPPIKQALQYTTSNAVLIGSQLVIDSTADSIGLLKKHIPNLASMIEEGTGHKQLAQYIDSHFAEVERFDSIVLGCTHCSHIKTIFNQLYPAVKVFDSVDGTVARIKKNNKTRKHQQSESTVEMIFSADADANIVKYQKILQEIFKYY